MAEQAAVEVRDIRMTYAGGTEALGGISLVFRPGELTSILGPSGSGKTTLLKIIAGLIRPTRGHVYVNGEERRGPGPDRALVFQDFALLPWATVLRNVAFGLELRGVATRQREEVARKCIDKVGLSGFEHYHPGQLSGGMRQRCGLARAFAVDADILLMDEPFSAVDEQMRRALQEDLLRLLAEERKTVILVTHSIEEAVYLSDRIFLLKTRPGRLDDTIEPRLDRSGGMRAVRRDPRYQDTIEAIWDRIRAEVH